jgi:hypothetical protein
MQLLHTLAALAIAIAGLALGVGDVLACACCTIRASGALGSSSWTRGKRDELSRLRFGPVALSSTGERDRPTSRVSPRLLTGMNCVSPRRAIAGHSNSAISGGRSGTLSLSLPSTVSIFEVDPRDEPDRGHGPSSL